MQLDSNSHAQFGKGWRKRHPLRAHITQQTLNLNSDQLKATADRYAEKIMKRNGDFYFTSQEKSRKQAYEQLYNRAIGYRPSTESLRTAIEKSKKGDFASKILSLWRKLTFGHKTAQDSVSLSRMSSLNSSVSTFD